MKKLWIFFILLLSICVFFILIIASSPYRQLRPYRIFGKQLPEKAGLRSKIINGRKAVLINSDKDTGSFYIDQRPVTISDYRNCVLSGNCLYQHYRYNYTKFWNGIFYRFLPVTFVNWMDARNFCKSAGGDLPSSLQWEIAAGSDFDYEYPWGNKLPNMSNANIDGFYQMLTPSGWLPKGASPFGILDMTGNVREWVLDEIYEDNDNKLLKGGGNADSFSDGRIDAYFDHGPTSSGFNRGFRCVYPVE